MTAATGLPEADLASIKGLLTALKDRKSYQPGPVAVAAVPEWSGPHEFTIDGDQVAIATAPSVLALRDVLRRRTDTDWLVMLTDRPATEIPSGVAEHLVTGRLVNLDPFPLLRSAFAASQQEFGLLGNNSAIARAVLREIGEQPTPAPGGVLTNEHVFTELAVSRFGWPRTDVTPHHVAVWSADPLHTRQYDTWVAHADTALADEFLDWLSRQLGELGPVLVSAWRRRGPAGIVPLGLVAGLLAASPQPGEDAAESIPRIRARLEMQVDDIAVTERQLGAWGAVASVAVATVSDPGPVLTAAEALVPELQARPLLARSDVLPSALAVRITTFAVRLAAAAATVIADGEQARSVDLSPVDNAWASVRAHRDAHLDMYNAPNDVQVGAAALRLLHRLVATPGRAAVSVAGWLNEYRADLSWVDSAINRAYVGADDPQLAAANHLLLDAVRVWRARLDREFASLLASAGVHRETGSGAPLYVEDVLDRVVVPITDAEGTGSGLGLSDDKVQASVLLVVADGMDVASANDIVTDATRNRRPQWQNCIRADDDGPLTAVAALPSVTQVSRCSLLSGTLAVGGQDRERNGFANWLQRHGLRGGGPVLFHKADLEAVSKGHSLASEVRQAVQDTRHRRVVACVLNDIDDALDRSDPIGTSWSVSSFKHLDALLTEAAAVGRTVVLVSDHGHVVERREQPSVQRGDQISARYRAVGGDVGDDEVLVDGERVLTDDHQAVLAVDEQLRYTRIKAGYHGGAALSEVAVSVSVLVNGAIPQGLEPSGFAPPAWWDLDGVEPQVPPRDTPAVTAPPAPSRRPARPPKPTKPVQSRSQGSLFDVGEPTTPTDNDPTMDDAAFDAVGRLLESDLFLAQFRRYGRNVTKLGVGALLREADAANGVVSRAKAAEILHMRPSQARGAIAHISQIFNVDGVAVIGAQGDDVTFALPLMFEQFGVDR